MSAKTPSRPPGLFFAGETSLAAASPSLLYRGYGLEELAEQTTFTEVAFLLWTGQLPTQEQFADLQSLLIEGAESQPDLVRFIARFPGDVSPLRIFASLWQRAGHFERETSPHSVMRRAEVLLSQLPHWISLALLRTPLVEDTESDEPTYADRLLRAMFGRPGSPAAVRALDIALIALADPGIDAATFGVRLSASQSADLCSALVSGMQLLWSNALDDPAEAIDLFDQVEEPAAAVKIVEDRWSQKARLPGFHARSEDIADPRLLLLSDCCQHLAGQLKSDMLEARAAAIEEAVWQHCELRPTVMWVWTRLLRYLQQLPAEVRPARGSKSKARSANPAPVVKQPARVEANGLAELARLLQLVARVPAWTGHYLEQVRSPHRLIPESRYLGPAKRVVKALNDRD